MTFRLVKMVKNCKNEWFPPPTKVQHRLSRIINCSLIFLDLTGGFRHAFFRFSGATFITLTSKGGAQCHCTHTERRLWAADPYRFAEPRIRINKTEEGKQERCRESIYLRDNSVRIAEIKMLLFTIINALLLLLLTMLPL